MLASELMRHPVTVVRAETTAREARALAVNARVEALPVIDTEGRLIGMVRGSERLAQHHTRRGPSSTVAEVMTSPPISLGTGATVGELASTILAHQLRVLPIVEDGKLVGVVDRNDLLRTLVRDDEVITTRVRSLLRGYAALRRWGVQVIDGAVTVSGAFVDRADREVVTALLAGVPGVVAVRLRMEHPIAATGSAG